VQEQIFGVVRAALEETLSPLIAKQAELEARLAAVHEAEQRRAATANAAATSKPAATSIAPAPSLAPPSVAPPSKASIVPTSYGLVLTPTTPQRDAMEVALENVGPIDIPDFGGRRMAGRLLVGLLIAGVLALVIVTLLSYT